MNFQKCIKASFAVIGKEGSTRDGSDFVKKLWNDANSHFYEIEALAKKDEQGRVLGIWGAMSDFSRSFRPWENDFSQGLYLAGVECPLDAEPPEGWTKWSIPSYEFIYVEKEQPNAFQEGLAYLQEKGIPLAGAVQDYTCPKTGKDYLFFPIEKR